MPKIPFIHRVSLTPPAYTSTASAWGSQKVMSMARYISVEHPPPLQQEAAVGHLMGEGVLEGIGMFWEEARLVEKLGGLEVRQGAM